MSIRPVNLDDLPDMSFEDLDTTLNKVEMKKNKSRRSNQKNMQKSQRESSPVYKYKNNHNTNNNNNFDAKTPSLTASSEGTTFSNFDRKYSIDSKTDNENFDDLNKNDDNDFFNDFAEFQNKKDGFDEALKLHFKLGSNSPTIYEDRNSKGTGYEGYKNEVDDLETVTEDDNDEMDHLNRKFNKTLNWNPSDVAVNVNKILRKPTSMMELKPYSLTKSNRSSNKESNKLKLRNSKSSGSLRARTSSTIRFKKSMPSSNTRYGKLSKTIFEGDEDYEDDNMFTNVENINKLNTYEENELDRNEDDFQFDDSLIQPQFASKAIIKPNSIRPTELSISPSQYDIIQDETLLTPRLHRRQKEWNNKNDHLKTFKEPNVNNMNFPRGNVNNGLNKIKTIKQEIDHNTPIKKGRMYYNPNTMNWEGNDHILDKFQVVGNSEYKRPMLIRSKLSDKPVKQHLNSVSSNNENPRVVGKMMFDDVNLRWVSMNEYEPDPFQNVPDIKIPSTNYFGNGNGSNLSLRKKESIANLSPFLRSQSHQMEKPSSKDKLTRFYSTGNYGYNYSSEDLSAFQISSKLIERFYHEENRWVQKINGWMILNRDMDENEGSSEERSTIGSYKHMYEIRNMVMNSSRG